MIIDVSYANGVVNWEDIKDKIEGAIIRCGYGSNIESQDDSQYFRNIKECERLNIPYGVYLYSYATTNSMAVSEGSHIVRLLEGHNPKLGVYLDIEEKCQKNTDITYNIIKQVRTIVTLAGFRFGIYANLDYFQHYINNIKETDLIWLAQWDPQPSMECDLWQYTEKEVVGEFIGDSSKILSDRLFDEVEHKEKKTYNEIAQEVIKGMWGNGEQRKENLRRAGYDYITIQSIVNQIVKDAEVEYHTVKADDTLSYIASKYNTSVEEIARINNIKNVDYIIVGQKVRVR